MTKIKKSLIGSLVDSLICVYFCCQPLAHDDKNVILQILLKTVIFLVYYSARKLLRL